MCSIHNIHISGNFKYKTVAGIMTLNKRQIPMSRKNKVYCWKFSLLIWIKVRGKREKIVLWVLKLWSKKMGNYRCYKHQ
jgi:hypothetical protein